MVRDLFDRNLSERPHLSSVFNLLGYSTALVAQQICGQDNLLRRLVTEYQWNGEEYEDIVSDMELSEYLQHAGFKVIQVPESEIKFPEGLNFVSLGKATFIGAKTQSSVISYVKKIHQVEFHTADVQGTLDSLTVVRKPIKHPEPSLVRTAVPSLHMPWASRRDTAALQSTDKILMVAPIGFLSNPQTIIDNHFMKAQHVDAYTIERLALLECSDFHRALTAEGVKVFLNCNEQFYGSPDALFPNNWFSTHPVSEDPNKKENLLVLYPMKAPARRAERREQFVLP
jgi:N-dimethylarginine dimethylaminohydrolase